jgi:2,3-bisphosphoglycerate-independent phosphoglycerate mutase
MNGRIPCHRAPVVLIIRDGWGENPHPEHDAFNAVKLAHTPVADALMRDWPNTLVRTCGEDVGLPARTMGNSEVGHQNIGAGRVVDQEIMRITRSIRDGSFFRKPALLAAFDHAKKTGGNVHFMGLMSDGKVHSDLEHLFALIDLVDKIGFPGERVFIHVFTDGRDVGPTTAPSYLKQLEQRLVSSHPPRSAESTSRRPRVASVIGRYYAMDRDDRWDRVAQAYQCLTGMRVSHPLLTEPTAARTARSAIEAVQTYYAHPTEPSRKGDEFITPTNIVDADGKPLPRISGGDAVIFYNFRGDRPREITKTFVLDDEDWRNVNGGGFERCQRIENLFYCTMTGYEEGLPVSAVVFDKPPKMKNILGQVVASAGLTQFRCAETEKFPHVTFFFNDYREQPFEGESRLLVPSPRDVTTYDQKPEMSAPEVCDGVIDRMRAPDCEPFIVVNFANPDMVGHTGNLAAAIKAVEIVDTCVGRIIEALRARGGSAIITADHGNAEQMWHPEHNSPHTSHTTYDVPLIIVSDQVRGTTLRAGGRLADIAPSVLALMGLPQPAEMTGASLLAAAAVAKV